MRKIPDFTRKIMRFFLNKKISPIWDGVFQDFETAKNSVPYTLKTDYETNHTIVNRIEFELNKVKISDSTSTISSNATQRFNFLSIFLSSHQEKMRVLDIGGAGGFLFYALRQQLTQIEIEILIYEYEDFVKEVNNFLFKNNLYLPKLKWTSKIPNEESFKVLYFGSSLQYFEDWRLLISNLVGRNNIEYLVISDTLLNPDTSFVTLQINIPGRAIPYMVVGIKELTQHLGKYGFVKILQNQNEVKNHTLDNFDYPFNQSKNQNLIYRNIGYQPPINVK